MLTITSLERRADRLFKRWDNLKDPYGLPLAEFLKENQIVREAVTISICLQAFKNATPSELKKLGLKKI